MIYFLLRNMIFNYISIGKTKLLILNCCIYNKGLYFASRIKDIPHIKWLCY